MTNLVIGFNTSIADGILGHFILRVNGSKASILNQSKTENNHSCLFEAKMIVVAFSTHRKHSRNFVTGIKDGIISPWISITFEVLLKKKNDYQQFFFSQFSHQRIKCTLNI